MEDNKLSGDHDHGENCDCGCEGEEETVTLTLEDDTEVECHVLGTFDVDDIEYIAVLPLESDEALIYRYKDVDGEIELSSIEDDKEFEEVSEAFYSFFGDDFEDDDEEDEEEDSEE